MEVITDHKWKQFKYRNEVPQKILDSEFDYHGPDEGIDGFFRYRSSWYHLDQFMRFGYPGPLGDNGVAARESRRVDGWHGYCGISYFSAVLIELSDDGEEYRVGLELS